MSADTQQDFGKLLCSPPHGWCWCVAWETPTWDGWTDRKESENKAFREELWEKGSYHGYVLYLEGKPIAWCRVGPRKTWPKLCASFKLDPDEDVHSFTCFGIVEEHKSKGYVHKLMELVLDDLKRRGVRKVEGFPRKVDSRMEDGEVWMGPVSVFRKAGFEVRKEMGASLHMRKEFQLSS